MYGLANVYKCSTHCCSVTQSCLNFCDPMDCSMPGFPVPHHLLEFAQVHVHWTGDAIQLSHPLLSSSPSTFQFNVLKYTSKVVRFPSGLDGKESNCNVGDVGLIPELGRSLGGWHGNPLSNSCLENPIDKLHSDRLQSIGLQWIEHNWSDWARKQKRL